MKGLYVFTVNLTDGRTTRVEVVATDEQDAYEQLGATANAIGYRSAYQCLASPHKD